MNVGCEAIECSIENRYQPLSRPVFIYVKKSAAIRPEVKAFTNFYLSPENAQMVLQVGDVPWPKIALQAAKSRFDQGMTGTKFGGQGSVIGLGREGL